MQLFYSNQISGNSITLGEEESAHCIRVLRKNEGDTITVIDGKGTFYIAIIKIANAKKTELEIANLLSEDKRNYYSHIAIAPTKNIERTEWFIEKAVEIGIDEISLICCNNSERTTVKTDRLNKVILSAVKQSQRATLPKLNSLIPFSDFIEMNYSENKFIAHCRETERKNFKNEYKANSNASILIGPEGDFTEQEIANAIKHGFAPVSLGNSRLRTETAAIVACNIVNLINE
jgi:16S rRNA (uracil1498-N3)-methyltransferase